MLFITCHLTLRPFWQGRKLSRRSADLVEDGVAPISFLTDISLIQYCKMSGEILNRGDYCQKVHDS